MTIENANSLIEKAKQFLGQEIEIKTLKNGKFINAIYKFTDISSITWQIEGEPATVDAKAKLVTLDGQSSIYLPLLKIAGRLGGKVLEKTPIKYKEVPFTNHARTHSVYVGAVPSTQRYTGEDGYLAYRFTVADGIPENSNLGKPISAIWYKTENEALKEGAKLVVQQIKQAQKQNK